MVNNFMSIVEAIVVAVVVLTGRVVDIWVVLKITVVFLF